MSQKKLVAFINAENEYPANIIKLADKYSCDGADGLFIYNYSGDEASREEFLLTVRKIEKQIDIPFCIGVYVDRFEDVINSLRASIKNISIFLTGSNSKMLSDELSSVLSGRYVLFNINFSLVYLE